MTDTDDLEKTGEEENEGESFAELFEQSSKKGGGRLEPGQKVYGRVLKVGGEWIFIDTSHKGEGVIDRKEFLDLDGNMTVREGDTLRALDSLSRVTQQCTACHAAYRLN